MKKILNLAVIAMLMGFVSFSSVSAEEDEINEEALEECFLEAHNRGYDIESDAFINRATNALVNDDAKTWKQICPKTYKKYH